MLPPYVQGSTDRRSFAIDGCMFHVYRSANEREVGFSGGGRDGDYVAEDAREPEVLARLLLGIDGLEPLWLGFRARDDETLDRCERALLVAAKRHVSIGREVHGDLDAATRLLALPRVPDRRRSIYVSHGIALTFELPTLGDGTVSAWAWGRDPGDFLASALIAVGVTPVPIRSSPNNPTFALPREHTASLLDAALAHLGPNDVRVTDS